MYDLTGVIGSRPQPRPEFETGVDVPRLDGEESATFLNPTDATVEHAVLGIFAKLPREVQSIVTQVAMELLRNAEAHARPQPGLVVSGGTARTLVLGWTLDGGYRYATVMVEDRSGELPEVRVSTRTGLKRVIANTFRCGAVRIGGGKRVWAMVDPQKR